MKGNKEQIYFEKLKHQYFMMGGFVSLISWHFILISIKYFQEKLDRPPDLQSFQFILFSNIIGTIFNFFLSRLFFKNYETDTQILFSLLIKLCCFTGIIFICQVISISHGKLIIVCILFFVYGFFCGLFHGMIAGQASIDGLNSVRSLGIGTGLCGIFTTFLQLLLQFIFKFIPLFEQSVFELIIFIFFGLLILTFSFFIFLFIKFRNQRKRLTISYTLQMQQ